MLVQSVALQTVSESVPSDVPNSKVGRGRPRKAPEVPLPVVTIEGSDRATLSTPNRFRLENAILSLSIPNCLLSGTGERHNQENMSPC